MLADQGTTSRLGSRAARLLVALPIVATLLLAAADAGLREAFWAALPLLLRYACTFVLPAIALWALHRTLGSPLAAANYLLLALAIGFVAYTGLAQSAAVLLLLAACLVFARSLMRGALSPEPGPLLTATLASLGLIVGLLGWLLPFPVHSALAYIALLALMVFLGRNGLLQSARLLSGSWQALASTRPGLLLFAVAVAGFAGVMLWLPSLNPDDNSSHLAIGNQLLTGSYFRLDVSAQNFALVPWFNNITQALLALSAGAEARSATGLIWLLFGAVGAFRLARALGGDESTGLMASALYASHPLTAYFGTTLQVDGASAACLMHLATICVRMRPEKADWAMPVLIGLLCGMLAGLKVTNLVYLALFGGWIAWVFLSRGLAMQLLVSIAIALVVGGSSYLYAFVVTGNPLFPLYNAIFKSAYLPAVNFGDPRWHSGVGVSSLWKLTFATGTFMEAYPGAAGLSLLALVGGWIVALRAGGRLAAIMLIALVGGAIIFFQVQYLRYIFGAMVLLGTVGVVAVFSVGLPRKPVIALLAALVIAQLGLVRTPSWILNSGVAEELLRDGPKAVRSIETRFVPEKVMIRNMIGAGDGFCLLLASRITPYVAVAPGKSLTIASYDAKVSAMAQWADADPSGGRWRQSLESIGVSHVELKPAEVNPGLMAALKAADFTLEHEKGDAQIWTKAGQNGDKCQARLIGPRDEAKRHFR